MIDIKKLKKGQLIKLTELNRFYLLEPINNYIGIVTEVNKEVKSFTFIWLKKHKEFNGREMKVSYSELNWFKVEALKAFPDE